jgi:membrane-associated phospholipid phosphatase
LNKDVLPHIASLAVSRLLVAAALCLFAIVFVDGPVARLFSETVLHHHQRKYAISSPVLLVPLAVVAASVMLWGRKALETPFKRAIVLAAASGLIAFATNNLILKPFFGRRGIDYFLYYPADYGFFFFKGIWKDNFPSGHMALIAAIVTIAWREFPRLRWISAAVIVLAAFLLLFGEWHFVSDLIAGAFWGNLIALIVVALSERLAARSPPHGADDKY